MAGEIVVNFDENGETIISVNGVKGKSCKDVTKFLERELGKVVEDKNTKEYYEVEKVKNNIKI